MRVSKSFAQLLDERHGFFFFQTFGLGHMVNGEILKGLGIMFLYWILQGINAMLMLVLVGLITAPLTWP